MKILDFIGRVLYSLSWPIINFIPITNTRVRCLVVNDNKLMLTKNWFGSNSWRLPGGGIQEGESPEQTAIRELTEEFTFEANDLEVKLIGRFVYRKHLLKLSIPVVLVKLNNTAEIKPSSWEISEISWCGMDQLPENCTDITIQALALLQ